MQLAYLDDLAVIHDAAFCQLAARAASMVIAELRRAGISRGRVVELGCGSGVSSRLFRDAGFDVVGIDISESLLRLAQERVPDVEFRLESFVTAQVPSCVAATAIGEVLNYTFDPENSAELRCQLFERIYRALSPGGLLAFDMAEMARAPAKGKEQRFMLDENWAVLTEIEADPVKNTLTRSITTFRKQGLLYQRSMEVHQLELVDRSEIVRVLEQVGFSVQVIRDYGGLLLPTGLAGFLGRKELPAAFR